MKVSRHIEINAPKEQVWQVISDIDNSVNTISGILKVEVLERPDKGLVGLKWKEYREMFGKEATEIMWITDAKENGFYRTRAESHGSIYISGLSIEDLGDRCKLTMAFEGTAVSFLAKVSNVIFSKMMVKSMNKALDEDLLDIKKAVEA